MEPPARDLRLLTAYLSVSGAATLGAGWLCLRLADRLLGLDIQTKAFLSAVLGGAVALLNVFIIAQLMFVSTEHDLKLLAAVLAFSAIVTGLFSLWVASTIAGRLGSVTSGIRALAAGRYDSRVDVLGHDEVARLAGDVNVLAGRLQAAEEERSSLERERRELTAAVSHDLRTPLASIQAMVEAMGDGIVGEEDERQRYYDAMRREIQRLSRMIDDLFELAKLDAGALTLDRGMVALQDIAAEVVDAMQAQARRKRIAIGLTTDGNTRPVVLDGARIERVVGNLLRNALEHTPAGGRVEVRIGSENGWLDLSVSDTGPGIEESDLAHIWDRFYRAERSRRRSDTSDGAGLGLATVRGIVEAHGGRVEARSSPGRGATFTVRLPANGQLSQELDRS